MHVQRIPAQFRDEEIVAETAEASGIIEDYLALLDQTDTYFEGIASYLKDQSEQGLFMPDYSVDKVIDQCDTIMDQESLSLISLISR